MSDQDEIPTPLSIKWAIFSKLEQQVLRGDRRSRVLPLWLSSSLALALALWLKQCHPPTLKW